MTPLPTASTHSFLDLPVEAKRRVDRVCLEFERADHTGRRIEDFLPRVALELRGPLLAELVGLEVDARRAAGEGPAADEYLARFPGMAAAVRAAFRQADGIAVGRMLGKYRLTGVLGRGGMGVVYEAEDPLIARKVAVKVLPDALLADPRARDRLIHEARLAGQLMHPNVVALFDVGEADGVVYLVLERVTGGTAADRLQKGGPLDWRAAAAVVADTCRGLAAIHDAGFLHLDIKPANVLLPGGPAATDGGSKPSGGAVLAKLTDFSLATAGDGGAAGGVVAGTPSYMSPEQRTSGAVSRQTDVFGLGATFFALLTGRAPFAGASVTEVVASQIRRPDPDPRDLNPAVPAPVARVVRRAMAPRPADRYPSAEAMLADLLALLAPPRPRKRVGVALGALALLAAAVAGVAVGNGYFADEPTPPPAPPTTPPVVADEVDTWEQLLDHTTFAGWKPVPAAAGNRPKGEFTFARFDTWPVLRGSGTGTVGLETEREFENYHLRFEYRWAGSGGLHLASVRYHCTGDVGAPGTHGMELHIQQAGSYVRRNDLLRIDRGELRDGGVMPLSPAGRFVPAPGAKEAPFGKWNRAAIVCVGDTAVHVLNDVPVVALARSRKPGTPADVPLTRGRIRLQSLQGEIFFRKVEIRKAGGFPGEYAQALPLEPAPDPRPARD